MFLQAPIIREKGGTMKRSVRWRLPLCNKLHNGSRLRIKTIFFAKLLGLEPWSFSDLQYCALLTPLPSCKCVLSTNFNTHNYHLSSWFCGRNHNAICCLVAVFWLLSQRHVVQLPIQAREIL